MANDTVTLALHGEVSLARFAEAIGHFDRLVNALANEHKATGIRWIVADLEVSSALATARAVGTNGYDPEQVEPVVRDYLAVGRALAASEPLQFSRIVDKEARALTRLVGEEVTAVRFETAEADAEIRVAAATLPDVVIPTAYGAVEGRVQTLTSRAGLRFTLYDTLYDRAVSCYLAEGYEEIMRDAWGHRAVVDGLVARDMESGRPLAVRRVTSVELLGEFPPGEYRKLRGIAPSSIRAEEAIRRLRDAG